MDIFIYQKKILKIVDNYFKKNKDKYLKHITDPKYYFNTWENSIGKNYIRFILGNKKAFFLILKKRISSIVFENLSLYYINNKNNINYKNNYKYVCISWALSKDFSPNGEFLDRYTNTSSRNCKNTIWILLNTSKFSPSKIDKNIILINRKYSLKNLALNTLILIKNLFLRNYKFIYDKFYIPGYGKFACIRNNIQEIKNNNEIQLVFTSYEAQPHQVGIFKFIQENFKDITTVGYIHSSLPPLPTEYLYKAGSPKKLLTHGVKQKRILVEFLNWNKSQIINIHTLRYKDKNNAISPYSIYLPYNIEKPNKILTLFKILIKKKLNYSTKNLIIKNHPIMEKSPSHLNLINKLKNIISNENKKEILEKNNEIFSVVIGATAVIIELIELGQKVYHISSQPLFDVYSPLIWKEIQITKIENNIYEYSLSKKNLFIKANGDYKSLSQIFESIK